MNKFTLSFISALVLCVPTASHAAYETPGQLLEAIEYDGGMPRNFDMKTYVKAESMHIDGHVYGAVEGRSPESMKAKLKATIQMRDMDQTTSMDVDVLIHNMTVYLRLNNIQLNQNHGLNVQVSMAKELDGKWITIPVDSSVLQADQLMALTSALEQQGVDFDLNQLSIIRRNMINAILTMEHQKYNGGHAYSIKLHPTFVQNAVGQLQKAAYTLGNSEWIEMAKSLQNSPSDIQQVQVLLDKAVNLHMKFNTDTEGNFEFGKFYFSFDFDDVYVAIEGKAESQKGGVTISVPSKDQTIPLEQVTGMKVPSYDWDPASSDAWQMKTPTLSPARSSQATNRVTKPKTNTEAMNAVMTRTSSGKESRRLIQQEYERRLQRRQSKFTTIKR